MLDRSKTLADRQLDVLLGDVVLEIDPCPGLRRMAAMRRHADEAIRADTIGLGREAVAGGAVIARGLCCANSAGRTVVQNLVEVINAAASAY